MTSGIYKILNTNNNKSYIGSSKEIEKRWKRHKTELKNNKHHSVKLQRAWNKENNPLIFEFIVLEVCENIELLSREQYWIDYYDSYNNGYNCSKFAIGCVSDPISAKVIEKSENNLEQIFDNLKCLESLKSTSDVQNYEVSYWSLKLPIAEASTGYLTRLRKATSIAVRLENELLNMDRNGSYRISDISYLEQGKFNISEESSSLTNSLHNKQKSYRILDRLWLELEESLNNKVGKSILDRFKNYKSRLSF